MPSVLCISADSLSASDSICITLQSSYHAPSTAGTNWRPGSGDQIWHSSTMCRLTPPQQILLEGQTRNQLLALRSVLDVVAERLAVGKQDDAGLSASGMAPNADARPASALSSCS